MSPLWLLPLGVGIAGAAALGAAARWLARQVDALERTVRPVRPLGQTRPLPPEQR